MMLPIYETYKHFIVISVTTFAILTLLSAPKFSKFHGLVEPIEPVHGLNDFTIDYEWDQVWPLVPKKRVIVPYGTRHGSAHSVFPIAPVYSYFNFWGLISREDER